MELPQVKFAVEGALDQLHRQDGFLLQADVAERSLSAKLACYLMPLFPDYDVDVEYNRHGLEPKKAHLPHECRGGGDLLLYPDIVIHRRGTDASNLLVIEVKKAHSNVSKACDLAKLQALREQFGYQVGAFIELRADSTGTRPAIEWI